MDFFFLFGAISAFFYVENYGFKILKMVYASFPLGILIDRTIINAMIRCAYSLVPRHGRPNGTYTSNTRTKSGDDL